MSAIHKLSIDTSALFISRSTNSSPPQREKHLDVRRSRSHGSSPLPKRMQLQIAKALAKETQRAENGYHNKVPQSPIFSRSSNQQSAVQIKESAATRSDGSGNSRQQIEQKERKVSRGEKEPAADGENKPRKKNSLVKNFLVNRLRSGSWHASSDPQTSKGGKGVARRVSADALNSAEKINLNVTFSAKNSKDFELTGLIQHVLESHLRDEVYDSNTASAKCGLLSDILEKAVKSRLNSSRKNFKISTSVYLGEIRDDGIKMATQCAWEPSQDHFAMATYESDHLFVSAMVFAVEYDDGYDMTSYDVYK